MTKAPMQKTTGTRGSCWWALMPLSSRRNAWRNSIMISFWTQFRSWRYATWWIRHFVVYSDPLASSEHAITISKNSVREVRVTCNNVSKTLQSFPHIIVCLLMPYLATYVPQSPLHKRYLWPADLLPHCPRHRMIVVLTMLSYILPRSHNIRVFFTLM